MDQALQNLESETSYSVLCDRVLSNDRDAEAMLMDRLQPGLRLILRRATGGDLELTRELCQDTLVVVLRRLRSQRLDDPAELQAFSAQTARNLAIAHRRKWNRRRTDFDTDALESASDGARAQPDQVAVSRIGPIVQRVLDQLPTERDRIVLRRYYLDEDDKAAICRDLSLSDLAFNQVLFRARNRFRELLITAGFEKNDLLDSEGAS